MVSPVRFWPSPLPTSPTVGLLVDGEIANNAGNWHWVAGTGNDTRPERRGLLDYPEPIAGSGGWSPNATIAISGVTSAPSATPKIAL